MRLQDYLNNVKRSMDSAETDYCYEGQKSLLETIQVVGLKLNKVIEAINSGIIKGDKGDQGIQGIQGERGEPGIASETINDNVTTVVNTWSSQKIQSELDNLVDSSNAVLFYKTNNGYLNIPSTKNGYINNILLEGRTTVNLNQGKTDLWSAGDVDAIFSGVDTSVTKYYAICKPNTKYTIIRHDASERFTVKDCPNLERGILARKVFSDVPGGNTFTTHDDANFLWIYVDNKVSDIRVSVIEGEVEDIEYHEGLQSVGGDVNDIYLNTLDINKDFKENYDSVNNGFYYFHSNGTKYEVSNMSSYNFINRSKRLLRIKGRYTSHITFFNNNSFLSGVLLESPSFDKLLEIPEKCTEIRVGCRNDLVVPSVYLLQDNKKLMYKDNQGSWKKPDIGEWDTIEKNSKGKYYYHKRHDMKKLLGEQSENWERYNTTNETSTIGFRLPMSGHSDTWTNNDVFCDLFNSISNNIYNQDIEGIALDSNGVIIKILRTKLNTQDVAGFKQWLNSNSVYIVHKLKNEEVYECTPLDLITYADETNFFIECGVVKPKSTVYVISKIGDIIYNLKEEVSNLQNYITSTMKLVLKSLPNTLEEEIKDYESN